MQKQRDLRPKNGTQADGPCSRCAGAGAGSAANAVAGAAVAMKRTFEVVNEAIFDPGPFEACRSMRPVRHRPKRVGANRNNQKKKGGKGEKKG